MAYNKYDSEKQAVSYMDGIPVKISEKYKPPKKITLPGGSLNKLNAEVVLPEYDFTLERSVMEKMSQWRDLRRSQREVRQERVEAARQARAVANEPPASSEEKSPPPHDRDQTASPSSKPYSILMPTPINASTLSQSTNYSNAFNISDFEQDNASPFDNLELKSINDKEELAHVLQTTTISDKNEINSDQKKSLPPRLNGFNSEYSYNGSLNWTNSYGQVSGAVYPNWYQDPNPTQPQVVPRNPTIQSFVVQRLDVGQNSKSVPDIVQQLELDLKDKREADTRRKLEQPQRPASIGPAELSRRSVSIAETRPVVSAKPAPLSSLPNPYSQLTAVCQQLTDRLGEMGFPLPRVARAAELFGDDETRVVEFLVQVQRLEEMDFPPDRAERALKANNYQETETIEYLKSVARLLELGFNEEEVEQALLKSGSDRDKALDLLIS